MSRTQIKNSSFGLSSIGNAQLSAGIVFPFNLSVGHPNWDSSGNLTVPNVITAGNGSNSNNWQTTYNTLSTLKYSNTTVSNSYATIAAFAASNPTGINKGSTVQLYNNRVYVFAGTDLTNPSHYLEINTNPIKPIYAEIPVYNANQAVLDSFDVTDFKSSKYTLQVETSFNNEIYYSEINVVGSVDFSNAVASEYGQISTGNLVIGYSAGYSGSQIQLIILFSSEVVNAGHKLIVRGHRTNFYKI